MAILQTCCCWQSVRKGSIASAYYSLVYHMLSLFVMIPFLVNERTYLQGNATSPASKSIIEKGTISHVSMAVSVTMVCLSCVGLITSFILLLGLYKNFPYLLLPWLTSMSLTIIVDVMHSIYLFVQETMKWNPMTAMIYTIDFFSIALNVYAMMCVISQYQELQAGRGRADNDANRVRRLPVVQFNARPTATSCLSTRHEATYNVTRASPSSPSRAYSPEGSTRGGKDVATVCSSPACTAADWDNGNSAAGCGRGSINHNTNGNTKVAARGRHVKFPDFDGPSYRQRLEHESQSHKADNVDVAIPEESKMHPAVDTAPLLLVSTRTPRSQPRS